MKPVIALLALMATSAMAVEPEYFLCSKDGQERRIEVLYPTGEALPCEVNYQKYGNTETLWSASSTEGYCFVRALELVEKHRGWGWQCDQQSVMAEQPEAPEAPEAPEVEALPESPMEAEAPEAMQLPEAPITTEELPTQE